MESLWSWIADVGHVIAQETLLEYPSGRVLALRHGGNEGTGMAIDNDRHENELKSVGAELVVYDVRIFHWREQM